MHSKNLFCVSAIISSAGQQKHSLHTGDERKIHSLQKGRHIFSHVYTHTHTQANISMSQQCSPHLRDPQSSPPQSLIPAASVSSFPLSSPSPAAYELLPTNKQGHSKHVVPHDYEKVPVWRCSFSSDL